MDNLRLPIFRSKREFIIFLIITTLLLSLHIGYIYKSRYIPFVNAPFILMKAKITKIYPSSNEYIHRVKLDSQKIGEFYTYLKGVKPQLYSNIKLFVYPSSNLNFIKFLKGSTYSTKVASFKPKGKSIVDIISNKIDKEHKNREISNFYQAIYLAKPLDDKLRAKITNLGISHLIALSGFHLGILSGVIIFIFSPLYKLLQKRYFPYRSRFIDIGSITLFILSFYLYFTAYPPSLIRAYTMMLIGLIAIYIGFDILNFTTLLLTIILVPLFFPSLLLSVAFWLSIVGVLYIFLLLRELNWVKSWIVKSLLITIGIFILMVPITHIIFGTTSIYQLLSPILSIIFMIFYPLSLLLHILGIGNLLDTPLGYLLSLDKSNYQLFTPLWLTLIYTTLSIASIFKRYLFYILFTVALTYTIYIYSVIL